MPPDLRLRTVQFEVLPETYARYRQATQALADERGHRLDENELLGALCDAVLVQSDEQTTTRAKFQIAITKCESCKRAWQEGGGARIAIDDAAVARAECDAQHIGSVNTNDPMRATQDVPPRVRRLIFHRDGGRCCVPGCRSSRNLELHHIVHRADGGDHTPSGLVLLCDGHHAAHHRGLLSITGTAPDRLEFRHTKADSTSENESEPRSPSAPSDSTHDPEPKSHVGTKPQTSSSTKFAAAALRIDARTALVTLGWKPRLAGAAVDEALRALGPDAPLEKVIYEALRRCGPMTP